MPDRDLAPATDDTATADDLIHVLEGRAPGTAAYTRIATFRPFRGPGGPSYTWRHQRFGERWSCRVRVRDRTGHETTSGEVQVTHPARPAAPPGQQAAARRMPRTGQPTAVRRATGRYRPRPAESSRDRYRSS